ncbi:MAG: anhydro-N-acetylmuramic acid kinase [Gammaproteobacteria bacterium]|nr:anhydro-N-acetylmuramic acid kinase [Gammaproteobacteria bacterium]
MATSSKLFIGLMSGTSMDGVDIAIVDFDHHPPKLVFSHTRPYESNLLQRLRSITHTESTSLDILCQLDIEVARFYASLVNQALANLQIETTSICAIGSHGQTLIHNPDIDPTYTLQIGDPNTLAASTGITTVADFRRRDMALGGQGAPLAPAFHKFLFHSLESNRVIVNIGGIANITCLPADSKTAVTGFDTGPGNTLLDYWVNLHRHTTCDNNGNWAASGKVIEELLQAMLDDEPYFKQVTPKSTGTEYFDHRWLGKHLIDEYAAADVQATLTELTATTIALEINQLPMKIEHCYVCGGGVHNSVLMQKLQQKLPVCPLTSTAEIGLDPDYVEAVAFAWLAQETLNQRPGNLPSVTQARAESILGGIFPVKTNR